MENADTINYGEVFGVEPETGNSQEAGEEPQQDYGPESEGAQEAADQPESPWAEEPEEERPGEEIQGNSRETSPAELNKTDYQRIEQTAREGVEREVSSLLSTAGLLDPYTQKPISSIADLRAYREHFESDRKREFRESHGMTEEQYQAYVNELPEVKAAREAAQRAAAEGARARLDRDLRELNKLDPQVKGLEDLAQRPEYPEICQMVDKGLSLPQAYKLVYFDQLNARAAQAAKQGALNSVNGKDHLQRSIGRGEGAQPVPTGVAEEYRMLMPDATEAEIQAHYNAYLKAHK